jgi:hypothetical protein
MAGDIRPMAGSLVAKMATSCRAEPDDLCAGTRMGWSDGQPTSGSAYSLNCGDNVAVQRIGKPVLLTARS